MGIPWCRGSMLEPPASLRAAASLTTSLCAMRCILTYHFAMRTTIDLDDDVLAAANQRRAVENVGLSAAINDLVRRGLIQPMVEKDFVQDVSDLGETLVPVDNIGEALEIIEGADHR